MKTDDFFNVIFAVILVGNLFLGIWNYLKGDLFGASVSGLIVFMIVLFGAMNRQNSRKAKRK